MNKYLEYRIRRDRNGWSVLLVSTLTGDVKDYIDSELRKNSALALCRKLNNRALSA